MDSKQIHIKATHLLSKGALDQLPLGGWRYCGRSDDLKAAEIEEAIEQHIPGDQVYFVNTRHDSRIEFKSDILQLIASTIDEHDFTIWSVDLCRVIEFKTIGVFRFGRVCG